MFTTSTATHSTFWGERDHYKRQKRCFVAWGKPSWQHWTWHTPAHALIMDDVSNITKFITQHIETVSSSVNISKEEKLEIMLYSKQSVCLLTYIHTHSFSLWYKALKLIEAPGPVSLLISPESNILTRLALPCLLMYRSQCIKSNKLF